MLRCRLLASFVLLSGLAMARPVSCRFVGLEGVAAPPPLVHVGAGGADTPCTVSANTISEAVACDAKDDVLTFLVKDDRKVAATAKIPAGVNAAILVFAPPAEKADGAPWRVMVIEDSAKNFPDAGAFVVNLQGQDLRFVIGEHKVQLKPSAQHTVARPEQRDEFNMAPVVFQVQQKERWPTISESSLRFAPGMRYLLLAYQDPESGRPRLTTYQDTKRAPATPAAP